MPRSSSSVASLIDWLVSGTKNVVSIVFGRALVSSTGRLVRTLNGVLATGYGRFLLSTIEICESPTKSR